MQLPGGLVKGGIRCRQWSFNPVSGALELALAEVADRAASTPLAVTRVLSAALQHLGGEPADEERVAGLCVGDRQFLMRALEQHLGCSGGWFHADCTACGSRFDFQLDYADLPVQEAGSGYPLARIRWQGDELHFRLPTGEDQARLAEVPDGEAQTWLLRQLVQEPRLPDPVDEQLIREVEEALEAVAPSIITRIQAGCPDCGTANTVELDPYRVLGRRSDELLLQVHQLASHYHWSEAEILGLPRDRRLHYLDLIDRSRGMSK